MEHIDNTGNADTAWANGRSESRFKTLLTVLRLGGIPLNIKSVSAVNTVYNATIIVCYYTTMLCLYMDTFAHRHHLVQAMKKLRVIMGMQGCVWMHFSLSYCKRDIEHLFSLTDCFTWEELPTRDPSTGHITNAGYIPIIQRLTLYSSVAMFAYHGTQSALRLVLDHDMVYTSWYPFDVSESPVYEIVNFTQVMASLFMVCIYAGLPSLYATLVCVACSQLEKLRASLLDIRQTQRDCGTQEAQGQAPASQQLFRHMQKQLNDCIRYHQDIQRYMQALEDTLNIPLCGLFVLSLSGMCFAAFSAVTSWGDITDLSQALFVYVLMAGDVCIYCWLGDELSQQAESVRDAAWGCDWVGTPVPFQRCLAFIIATANKEFTLTAGKFVPVCKSTMLNMMNQSVSFFMFLLHMKDENTATDERV